MNLSTGLECLDVFCGLFKNANPKIWWENPTRRPTLRLPLIHAYGLTSHADEDKATQHFAKVIKKVMKHPKFTDWDIEDIRHIKESSDAASG